MSTNFYIRVTNLAKSGVASNVRQHIVGDSEDTLLAQQVSARWFDNSWEMATNLYLSGMNSDIVEDSDTTGEVYHHHDGFSAVKRSLDVHRQLLVKLINEMTRRSKQAFGEGRTARELIMVEELTYAGVTPRGLFDFIELVNKAIRLMVMFADLGLATIHVTVAWS